MTSTVSKYGPVSPTIGLVVTPTAAVLIALQISAPGIPPRTVRQAENIVSLILAHAGVAVVWDGPADYHIQIMNSQPRNLSPGAAGFAVLTPGDSGYAAISFPSVVQTAAGLEADPANLLGASLAHELGHLLLGAAHTQGGVMRAHFRRQEIEMAGRGELLFDAGQVARIRSKLLLKSTSVVAGATISTPLDARPALCCAVPRP
jgi:hypothetical protein